MVDRKECKEPEKGSASVDKEPTLIDLKGAPCSGDKELAPRDIKGAVQIAIKNLATSVGPMGQSSTKKRRLPLIDAATAPSAILVEDGAAGLKRHLPMVDAALTPSEDGSSDSNVTDVKSEPEISCEEELLREVGLQPKENVRRK